MITYCAFVLCAYIWFSLMACFIMKVRNNFTLELSDVNREYFHWAVNCVLFITLYAVFITQKELVKIEEIEIEKAV